MKKGYCLSCSEEKELPDGVYCEECIETMKRGGVASD